MNAEDAEDAEKDGKKKVGSVAVYGSAMRPHPRIRKVVKWGGLVLAAFFFVAWWATPWFSVRYFNLRGTHVSLSRGSAWLMLIDEPTIVVLPPGFTSESHDFAMKPWFSTLSVPGLYRLAIPLWFLFLMAAIPTALAWRLDTLARRREKMHACPSCGYDRSGITPSSHCPECGTAA